MIRFSRVASAVNIAARLSLSDRLAQGPRSADDLARETGVNADALYRVMRALSSLGVYEELQARTFALTPAGAALCDGPMRSMALWIAGEWNFQVYANAMHSVKTGESAVPATTGNDVFEHFAKNPELSKIFNDAMSGFSDVVIPAVLEAYDFSGIRTLVDIAGANAKLQERGVADRCSTASGDFFKAVPSGGDAYIMKLIIHDWDDEKAARILENIRKVLPKNGRVLLVESVIPSGNEPGVGKVIDLEMLVMPGGKERTEAEFRALFDRAGYTVTRIVPTKSPMSVIEATPKS